MMQPMRAFGGLAFAERMYMARLELTGLPRVVVYEVDPKSLHVPEYKAGNDGGYLARCKPVPREQKAWFGSAERKLCRPGFAAFGGSEQLALESLLRVMREHRDNGTVQGLGDAIRVVMTKLEGRRDASRATV